MSWPTASWRCSWRSLISLTSSARSSSRTRVASSRISARSSSGPVKPRAIRSGVAVERAFEEPGVVITISTPSSERRLPSRSATSWTSPTPSPSTKITPHSASSTIRAPPAPSSTAEPGRPHEDAPGAVHVAEVARDVRVLAHRAADAADLAPDLHRDVDRLLHPVDVGGERGDEDAALPLRDDLPEGLADDPLGGREARP